MSRPTAFTIALAGLAVVGLSGCATDNKAAPASTSAITTASTSTAAPSSTSFPAPRSTSSSAVPSETAATTQTGTASPTVTTSTPMVGGTTACTENALAEPAPQAAQALGADNVYTLDELSCSDGWAVTSGLLASKNNPEMGAPTSFIFEQEGLFRIPREKAAVCGPNPTTTTAPADAEIPADLFLAGCAAG